MNGMEAYDEIEKAGLHTEPGHYGRAKQYSDPEFTHDDSSVGAIEKAELVQGWRVSQGININATLFKNGTDPDDVFQGQLNDGWLLSALSIVAASGGVGDDSVRRTLRVCASWCCGRRGGGEGGELETGLLRSGG